MAFNTRNAKELLRQLDELQKQQQTLLSLPSQYSADAQKQARSVQSVHGFENLVRDEVERGQDSSGSLRGADALVRSIVCCHKLQPIARYCQKLTGARQEQVQALRDSLAACAGGLKRFFASSSKKQDAEQAFAQLQALLNSDYAAHTRQMTADANAITQMTPQAAWQEWRQNRGAYRQTAQEALGSLYDDKPIAGVQAVLEQHELLLAPKQRIAGTQEQRKQNILNACNGVAAAESLRVLEGVPVEEVNRDKGGIRVKTLRDSGFETMADICFAKPGALAAVKGISAEGESELKKIAKEYRSRTASSVKIKLSTDNRTAEASALVYAVYTYIRCQDACTGFERLHRDYGKSLEQAGACLRSVGNGALWLFTADTERQNVASAYRYLNGLLQGDYGRRAKQLAAEGDVSQAKTQDAWDHFAQNTVRYYNVIEDIAPGMLGTDSGMYGLPEDLAHAVAQEPFYPEGLRCELRRYQEWGVKYALCQKRVLLGDEMGLGKTVQAIAVMVSLRNTGSKRFLVICPASVLSNWHREITKHSDLPVTVIHGSGRDKALAAWRQSGGVGVTTYETTAHFDAEQQETIDIIVVDEAHYIKNAEARRSVNVKKLCAKATRLLFMTGTAIENRVEEMIALVSVLQPEVAAHIKGMAFMSSAPQFREAVAPVYYRRKREDVLTELPDKVESAEWCTLGREEERLYEEAVLGKKYADARRVSWAVSDLSQSCKASRMNELLAEAGEEGRKVIIFSFFLDTITKISALLGERCVGPITGSIPPQRRQELIDTFDKAPAGAVLTAQIQSGGTGLNIQSASVVMLCEPQFKPSIENQAISRAYRMGQSRNVLVYRLLCEDTVDEKIMDMLKEKQAVFDAFADKSTIAEETMELDETSFGEIMREEAARIAAKRQGEQPETTEVKSNEAE